MNKAEVEALYASMPYLEAYRAHTDMRAAIDPQQAVGARWDVMGPLQFNYLVDNGLARWHRMLDIGCGTLRGGRHFIRYLDPDRYTGVDISSGVIAAAKALVVEEELTHKRPTLLHNPDPYEWFGTPRGATYQTLLAQSVFTHLDVEYIEKCFRSLGSIMAFGARFFFTFNEGEVTRRRNIKGFAHPFSMFSALAQQNGFELERRSDYAHPLKQVMVILRRAYKLSPR
jgi:SAM-dependent methyltransferase